MIRRSNPFVVIVFLMFLLAALTQSGCVGAAKGNPPSANPPTSAALTVSPLSLDFGDVQLGSTSSRSLTLTNSGTAAIMVSQASVTGTGFSISPPAPLPLSLAAGQSATVSASFAPTATGSASGSISVLSSASSSPVTITLTGLGVSTPPSITTQPANQTVTAGQTATFSVVAAGTAPLSYQWQKNGTAISGATSASYTTPATTTSDTGALYAVVVSNSAGNMTSNAATLTVNAPLGFSISSQPASQTLAAGSSVSYTLTVTSQAGFNGTVSFSAAGLPSGATATFNPPSLNGSGSSTVIVSTDPSAPAGSYTVSMTGTSGSLTNSVLVNLTINSAPSGVHYYVSPTGSDSNPGTSASPWATIQHAAQSITSNPNGVTVHIAAGAYTGSVTSSLSGTASGRVQFVSDVKWGAKLDGQGTDYAWNMTGDYQDIVGLEITNAARAGVRYTSSHTRVLNAKIHDVALGTPCDAGGGAGWEPDSTTSVDAEISNSIIYNIGPGSPTGARCNTIHGIYFAIPDGRAVNNLISMVTGDCITSWHLATSLIIENNVVMGCPDAGILIGSDATTIDNTVVANNIVLNSPIGIAEEGNLGTHNSYVNNLEYNVPTLFQQVTGTPIGTITTNPLVVNNTGSVSTGDYHLQSGSPAIDHGTNQYCPSADFDGYARPYGSSCDIGAYEWHP